MAESLLKNLDIKASSLELIAVASGPGSFTGVRIGVSAAKGLALGLGIPVCGVSTLEAMTYQIPEPGSLLCPTMDARRSQVYNALFRWNDGALIRLREDRAISLEALAFDINELRSKFPHILLIGDGAAMTHEYLLSKEINCRQAPYLLRYQTAFGVALASRSAKTVSASELEPSYLRPSQAERERNTKIQRNTESLK